MILRSWFDLRIAPILAHFRHVIVDTSLFPACQLLQAFIALTASHLMPCALARRSSRAPQSHARPLAQASAKQLKLRMLNAMPRRSPCTAASSALRHTLRLPQAMIAWCTVGAKAFTMGRSGRRRWRRASGVKDSSTGP